MSKLTVGAAFLGSADFPLMPEIFSKEAFSVSASEIKGYLKSTKIGLGIPEKYILDLFGSADPIERQDNSLCEFLLKMGSEIDVLIIYYVGHGGFLSDRQYFLSVKTTDPRRRHFTGLKARDLAETLKNAAPGKKIYLILDCCFAGAAVDTFQSNEVSTLVEDQTYDSFGFGTALFAASSRDEPAVTPEGGTHTMFSKALLSVLSDGISTEGDFMSLRSVAEETAARLRQQYGREAVQPQVHTPRQVNGDIADLPLFPNRLPRSARTGDKAQKWRSVYDSESVEQRLAGWNTWLPVGVPGSGASAKAGVRTIDGAVCYYLETSTKAKVGLNRNFAVNNGYIGFRYKVIESTGKNVAFYAIPMRYGERWGPARRAPGAEIFDQDQTFGRNSLRIALVPSDSAEGWHDGELHFDFSNFGSDVFVIFAPRINEGQETAGRGYVAFKRVQFYSLERPDDLAQWP